METIGNYPDLASAQLAQSVLAGSGIESEIPDEFLSGIDWQMGTALQGVSLRVLPEDAEAARAILEDLSAQEDALAEIQFPPECEVCGGDGPEPPRWKRRLKGASLLFAPLLLVYAVATIVVPARACAACGKT